MMTLLKQAQEKVQTSKLNNMIQAAVKKRHPPAYRGKSPRIYYAVQTDSTPPTFRIFTSNAINIKNDYRRFIAKYIREHSPLREIPLKIEFVSKEEDNNREHRGD
jgi:GTP-binding protein